MLIFQNVSNFLLKIFFISFGKKVKTLTAPYLTLTHKTLNSIKHNKMIETS